MMCFKRLVSSDIEAILPNSLDHLQFAYHPNQATDDAISTAFHVSLMFHFPRGKKRLSFQDADPWGAASQI